MPHLIDPPAAFTVEGEGGPLTLEPLVQVHGDIHSLGFRIGRMAYCPDISDFPASHRANGCAASMCWSSTRCSTRRIRAICRSAKRLQWIERLKPGRAVLTHMHTPLDYATVAAETPDNVEPAYDGLVLEIPY